MRRLYIPIILFLLLALEGVAIDFLPSVLTDHKTLLIPHWVLIYSFLIALFYDHDYTYYSMIYAAIFGFLIDIVYTDILGVYMFAYALGTYIVLLLKRAFHVS